MSVESKLIRFYYSFFSDQKNIIFMIYWTTSTEWIVESSDITPYLDLYISEYNVYILESIRPRSTEISELKFTSQCIILSKPIFTSQCVG